MTIIELKNIIDDLIDTEFMDKNNEVFVECNNAFGIQIYDYNIYDNQLNLLIKGSIE